MTAFNGIRFSYAYQVFRAEDGLLCAEGASEHCFLDEAARVPVALRRREPEMYNVWKQLMGSPLEKNACIRFQKLLSPNIFNGYGTTETFWNSFLRPYDLPEMAGTAGRSCTDDEVRLVHVYDDRRAEPEDVVPTDGKTTGEIIIFSPFKSALSYLDNPELTAEKYYKGWLYTHDLGTWDEQQFVTVSGRKDDMMNQRATGVLCVYCAIGQKTSSVAALVHELEKTGTLEHTVVVASTAADSPAMLRPRPGTGNRTGAAKRESEIERRPALYTPSPSSQWAKAGHWETEKTAARTWGRPRRCESGDLQSARKHCTSGMGGRGLPSFVTEKRLPHLQRCGSFLLVWLPLRACSGADPPRPPLQIETEPRHPPVRFRRNPPES